MATIAVADSLCGTTFIFGICTIQEVVLAGLVPTRVGGKETICFSGHDVSTNNMFEDVKVQMRNNGEVIVQSQSVPELARNPNRQRHSRTLKDELIPERNPEFQENFEDD
jgi:hypothetical protein